MARKSTFITTGELSEINKRVYGKPFKEISRNQELPLIQAMEVTIKGDYGDYEIEGIIDNGKGIRRLQ